MIYFFFIDFVLPLDDELYDRPGVSGKSVAV